MFAEGVFGRVGLSISAVICVATAVLAGATIWLMLTEPMTMARALDSGDLGRLANALLGLVTSAVRAIVAYL
jgi:hypothetical protein